LAKRLTEKEIKEIILLFTKGKNIEFLSDKFKCTKLTIVRNVKKNLGDLRYKELIDKNKFIKKDSFHESGVESSTNSFNNNLKVAKLTNQKLKDEELFIKETFLEIAPLDYEIENSPRKELSSVPISEVDFPETAYMVVDNKIELKIKILKDYPNWQFLPIDDLNRKTIEIYFDMKTAKRFCSKEQKVIRVPNTNVFKIVAPFLVSRGVSRIVSEDILIAL
tara:strand:- start:155 stop:817 length:663 start_codon:yes stop_codon:yes gene_type:complete